MPMHASDMQVHACINFAPCTQYEVVDHIIMLENEHALEKLHKKDLRRFKNEQKLSRLFGLPLKN